ncbi:MAG: hypothetical protein KDD39_03145 [Bdellovibrionales bacterium]|nr:hypothetical protein [Bdellovibrionales bacterium]
MNRLLVGLVLVFGLFAPTRVWTAEGQTESFSLQQLRMEKRFGFGVSAAGPLSLLGLEIDINLSEEWSIGGGLGTGLDYNTMMVKARYFMLGKSVSPYVGAGIARWWSKGTSEASLSPSLLSEKMIDPGTDLRNGFDVFMVYPCLGVQFMHPMGMAVFAELQYFFKLFNLANGAYAGLGMHWYF